MAGSPGNSPTSVTLTNALLPSGELVDVEIVDGLVSKVSAAAATSSISTATSDADAASHNLNGSLLLPAPAEPHAHLDKAFTADLIGNPTGDLDGAITSWRAHYDHARYSPEQDFEATVARASHAVELAISNGITAIRSHANVGENNRSTTAVKALAAVRDRYADRIDMQVAALIAPSVVGAEGAFGREQAQLALEDGADLMGGCPMLEDQPLEAVSVLLDIAADAGVGIDLHTDETLDAEMLTLVELCRQVQSRGFAHPVTASHCVSLGVLPAAQQTEIAKLVAESQVSVVTLPQTNLFLQGRGMELSPPRGLTAIDALLAAGATVAGGGDNVQDPFNPVGLGDALETASLIITAGHQLPEVAYDLVSSSARSALNLPPAAVAPGATADFLAVDVPTIRAAVAGVVSHRRTFKSGRLISEKQTRTELF